MIDLRTTLRLIADGAARCAFPDHCVFCGVRAPRRYFCASCFDELPRTEPACGRCGVPLATPLPDGIDCADCRQRPPPFEAARAPLVYAFPVDAAVKALKFRRQLHYAPAFAELLQAELIRHFPHADALVPVPLYRWRHVTRGFNQAAELCKPLCRRNGLPLFEARRIRHTRPQSGLNVKERRRNLRGAFTVRGSLRCRHPLIVDDVMTTGETCRQLAEALLRAGASTVGVLTVARAAARG